MLKCGDSFGNATLSTGFGPKYSPAGHHTVVRQQLAVDTEQIMTLVSAPEETGHRNQAPEMAGFHKLKVELRRY